MSFLTTLSQWLVATLEPYGAPGLMLIAIVDSSFLSLPEVNDAALMALSINNPSQMWLLAAMTVIGSVIGCSLLYGVGRKGGEALLNRRFAKERVARIRTFYEKYGMLAVIVPSLLPPPLPFKIFVLSAGAFRIPWGRFMIAVGIGRSVRYFAEGILAVMYGRQAIQMVAENSARVGVVLAVLIVIGAIVYVYTRRHRTRSGIVVLPLAFALLSSGCIVRTRTIGENKRMKESHPFTRAQALERLRQFSQTVETLQTSISLSGTLPDPKKKNTVKDFGPFTGGLVVERPGQIALDAGLFTEGFEMRSNGKDYEVYSTVPTKQVHLGAEADLNAKSSCKISDLASPFMNIRPRQIAEALVPDFRPLLDSRTIVIHNHVLPVPDEQREYFILDIVDTSAATPRTLQEVWFDLSSDDVDIVRRLTFDAQGAPERITDFKNHMELGSAKFRYPMRFDVQFMSQKTLLKVSFVEPKKIDLNEKVDADAFAFGTHKNAETCRMVPTPVVAKQ